MIVIRMPVKCKPEGGVRVENGNSDCITGEFHQFWRGEEGVSPSSAWQNQKRRRHDETRTTRSNPDPAGGGAVSDLHDEPDGTGPVPNDHSQRTIHEDS